MSFEGELNQVLPADLPQRNSAIRKCAEHLELIVEANQYLNLTRITTPRDAAIKLYAMLGNPLVRASPKFRALQTFHDHILQSIQAQQWEKARGLIEQCRKLSGASQKLYDLHEARIAWYEKNPPPADWDGAFRPVLK